MDPAIDERFRPWFLLKYDEAAWSDTMSDLAWESLREHPSQVVPVVWRNARVYFELEPSANELAESFDGRNLDFRRWTLPAFYVVTVVGWIGLILRRRDPSVILLITLSLYFTATSLLFVAPPRLRTPFDFIGCIGVGFAIDALLRRREVGRSKDHSVETTVDPLTSTGR